MEKLLAPEGGGLHGPKRSPEHIRASEQQNLARVKEEYEKTLAAFPKKDAEQRRQVFFESFARISERLAAHAEENSSFTWGERQTAIVQLKLARYFQRHETVDLSSLCDAIIETPSFIDTAKGGFDHLLDIHERKQLVAIAERRKRVAERTGEGFNPYEILYTTPSGKYAMARLLNMPHLEEESDYMKHCVGNSDSYINKIKRGDIEILSFRTVPTINTNENRLHNDDTPLITIEYNLRTGVIEQIKKAGDAYLSLDDPFYEDFIQALKQLRTTKTDTGMLRHFTNIDSSELQDIRVKDFNVLTDHGSVYFKNFDPTNGDFVLKIGRMDITPFTEKEDAAKILKIVEGITIEPASIAYTLAEITENTNAYIGHLEPDIFQKFPATLEHIYTLFPKRKIRRAHVTIDGTPVEQLISNMEAAGVKATDIVKTRLRKTEVFMQDGSPEDVDLFHLTCASLGFNTVTTTHEIIKQAQAFGLELCSLNIALDYRLKYQNQPLDEGIYMLVSQTVDRAGNLFVLKLKHGSHGLELQGLRAQEDSNYWNPGHEFVFRLRKADSGAK